ncbi:hypothetical protein AYW79_10985 [Ferroacidibacillus organovorans]|uniref:Uncharacterized protein n=1 Tax=Ferroacidibacillus organovorans TaxID=1765683 RepID=A0A162S0Y4_9BACL|nr:hypothetical protein AYJ22_14650 [Ferroacidibacillus organovorans]KYP80285.1 hypothetical protein AYJ22_11830 [Ferroacidibacillus organovorans]OAG93363.1 hypothetical protein AYW79_10985 [Ferroacidibacillus organovorans]
MCGHGSPSYIPQSILHALSRVLHQEDAVMGQKVQCAENVLDHFQTRGGCFCSLGMSQRHVNENGEFA